MLEQILATVAIFILSSLLFQIIFTKKDAPSVGRCLPGPFALPVIGHLHLIGPNIHQAFHNLSQRYGPIIQLRLGSNRCVVVSTPELAKEFLKTNEVSFAFRKNSPAIKLLTYDVSFAFAPYGPYWKFIKKMIVNKLLGNRNMNIFEPIRTLEVHRFLQDLGHNSRSGEAINLTNEFMKLTSNIISQMMLSIRCADTDGEAENARNVIRDVSQIFGEFDVSDVIWFFKNFDVQGIKKRAQDIHQRYDALLEKIISERERKRRGRISEGQSNEIHDFLDMLLDAMEDDESEIKLSRNHIKAIILDFLTAATDTTAISLEWAIAELINNPSVLKKAQDEIEKVVGNQRLVRESDTNDLPYIRAIIKEIFRLHPPIPMLIRKSPNDCEVAGYHIPANTMLFVNIWSIGKNPSYWKNPSEFRPERFLEAEPDDRLSGMDITGQHFELMPFGTGRRGCPGMPLAMQELPTVLALLVQCFNYVVPSLKGGKIDGSDGVLDMSERPGLTVPKACDLICLLKPRIDLLKLLEI